MPADALRDTDADWRHLGATEPYWGVLTQDAYKRQQIDAVALEGFYATGRDDIAVIVRDLERADLGPLRAGRALDFGCGVGRLTEAMRDHADEVVGYDISPGMLETAAARARPGVSYASTLPDGPFDWNNSLIVFQHIPPRRGLALMAEFLDRLAPGGALSLQLTVWTDQTLHPPVPPAKPSRWAWSPRAAADPRPTGTMVVYDYDMNVVIRLLNERQIGRLTLNPTDHGGHHGVTILARREVG
jgi:SAM-dependent methyltransferase